MSIGKTLEAARIQAGMTVTQVSDATRVRQTLVRQIEANDYSHCGGDFYARGHIRNIAQVVGIDPVPLVAEFDRQHSATQTPLATQVFEPDPAGADRRGPNWNAAMAVALAVVCIWALVQLFTPSAKPRKAEPLAGQGPQPTATASTPSSTPTTPPPTTSPPAGDAVASVPRDGVTVRLIGVSGSSWVRVTGGKDGHQLFESILRRGEKQDFTDKQLIRVVVGNAGAVQLIVNGKDLGMPGDEGQVIRLKFGPGDPQSAG